MIALQALVLILAAAHGGGGKQETETPMGHSSYLQSYAVPFAGPVPPIKPSIYNDEFNRQKPPANVPGFVQFDPKWKEWSPGVSPTFGGIDTQRQMALVTGAGDKEWFGYYQDMPLPVVGGPVLSYQLYLRCMLGLVGGVDSYTDLLTGLILAEDLLAAPATSPLWTIQQRYARVGTIAEGSIESSEWANYSALDAPAGSVDCGWPLQYVRARVSTQAEIGPAYLTNIYFDVSPDGIGWQSVSAFEDLEVAIRSAGFGMRTTGNQGWGSYYDYFRWFPFASGDERAATGGRQELGSV